MSYDQSAQIRLQAKLLEAARILNEAGKIADENNLGDFSFMGLVFEHDVGWFSPDGELQQEAHWNHSACVIGSQYADGYGMEGWKKFPSSSGV